jgi:hypothetical protein
MRNLLTALALALCSLAPVAAQDTPTKVLTVVTSPDPQTQLMAMVLTRASMAAGADAHILLCGPAADIALREPPESAITPQPPRGMSPKGLMTRIMEAGGTVDVCAIYLPGLGLGPEVLSEGIGSAMPPAMAAMIVDPTVKVLSF